MLSASEEDRAIANRFVAIGVAHESTAVSIASLPSHFAKLIAQPHVAASATAVLSLLDRVGFHMEKMCAVETVMQQEMDLFDGIAQQEQHQLETIQKDIALLEQELVSAKREKVFRDKCDVLATLIKRVPARVDTAALIQQTQLEMDQLRNTIHTRREVFKKRFRKFEALFEILGDLEKEEEEKTEERESKQQKVEEEGVVDEEEEEGMIAESVINETEGGKSMEEEEEGAI